MYLPPFTNNDIHILDKQLWKLEDGKLKNKAMIWQSTHHWQFNDVDAIWTITDINGDKVLRKQTDANRVCENGNSQPSPIELDTQLYLRDIGKINEEENLITMQMTLYNWWTDPSLEPSNTSKSLVELFFFVQLDLVFILVLVSRKKRIKSGEL